MTLVAKRGRKSIGVVHQRSIYLNTTQNNYVQKLAKKLNMTFSEAIRELINNDKLWRRI